MVREVSYKVTEKSIEPANKQWLGMQREDCATKVLFDVSKIPSYSDYKWRIDFDQASAGYSPGTPIENSGSNISRDLPYNMTRFGGDVQITVVGSSEDGEIVYSIPAKGYLTAVSQSEPSENETAIDISSAEISAKQSALDAEQSANEAAASAEEANASAVLTENTRRILEEDSEFVFNGGTAESAAEVDVIVEDVLTEHTANPVEGRAIVNYINSIKTALLLEAHPVGSLYISSNATSPAELFGGTWRRITDKFILAAGNGIGAAASGGKSKVKLSTNNLPAHYHEAKPVDSEGTVFKDYEFTVNKNMSSDSVARYKVAKGNDYYVLGTNPESSDYRANDITATAKTTTVGSGEEFEILPPFVTKYVWERTA
jgi:hypothetical protein